MALKDEHCVDCEERGCCMKIMKHIGESLTNSIEDIGGQFKDVLNKQCEKLVNVGYNIMTKCDSCEHVYDNDYETRKYFNFCIPLTVKKKIKSLHEEMEMKLDWKKGLLPVTCIKCKKAGVYIMKKQLLKHLPKYLHIVINNGQGFNNKFDIPYSCENINILFNKEMKGKVCNYKLICITWNKDMGNKYSHSLITKLHDNKTWKIIDDDNISTITEIDLNKMNENEKFTIVHLLMYNN